MGDFLIAVFEGNLGSKLTVELANGLIQSIERKHYELVAAAVVDTSQSNSSVEVTGDVA